MSLLVTLFVATMSTIPSTLVTSYGVDRVANTGTRPDTIVLGHPLLRDLALRVGSDTTDVFLEQDGERRQVSTGIRTVARVGDTYVVSFTAEGRGGASVDSLVVAADGLAATRHTFLQPGAHTELTYHDSRVTGLAVDSAGEHHVDIPVAPERLDLSVVGPIASALPHAPGTEEVFRAFDAVVASDRDKDIGYRVVGREQISWHGRTVDIWKTVTDFGTHQVTAWLSMDGRELCWEIVLPGRRMAGELRE